MRLCSPVMASIKKLPNMQGVCSLIIAARRLNELPSAKRPDRAEQASGSVRVGMCFCKVPVDERKFLVTIKLSRWRGPDKWAGFVMSR